MAGGLAGATLLTLVHETVRRAVPKAPRMDLLGMQALAKGLHKLGLNIPNPTRLFYYTMAGDLVSNALYYSLGGVNNRKIVLRATLLGLAAGVGAILLPEKMGLNDAPSSRTTATKLMTVGLYLLGGLAAGIVQRAMQKKRQPKAAGKALVL
ncbi:hypothetical protein GCM10023184_20580 [Flaviaesturariibacter amylovorans]|uniref:Uncharacterized protein n=2 Tax=Flaviaesturariibacter amylovorans TaxID=1084520 RepID=A0ABP8GTL4_9BACT